MKITKVGDGNVVLIAGGGKTYIDTAARFCRSKKSLDDIISAPYNKKLVDIILKSGHLAATEFDWWIFGAEGYSRTTEIQLVRKRMASYLIKSAGSDNKGNPTFDVVLPDDEKLLKTYITLDNGTVLNIMGLLSATEKFYNQAISNGVKAENARFIKPQGTETKMIIGMNTHSLLDWFKLRCCNRAQPEIRDLAWKMLKLCKEKQPDVFKNAGPRCLTYGFCPEMEQCEQRKGKIPTLDSLENAKDSNEYKNLIKKLLNK